MVTIPAERGAGVPEKEATARIKINRLLEAAGCGRATGRGTRRRLNPARFPSRFFSYKKTKEIDAVRLRPHPHEFFLYYDI